MDRDNPYYRQVQLLLRVLPLVFREDCFALKGGTAINLFVRDFPRLSVDIDLVFLPGLDRTESLQAIHLALDRVAESIRLALPRAIVVRGYEQKDDALRLTVSHEGALIKIELSPVLRGTLYPPVLRRVVAPVEEEFGFVEVPVVHIGDLYGGKLCAALDRQHPRDLFDTMLLLENEGVTDMIRKGFLVYLVSHARPMEELLSPRWHSLSDLFHREFRGMAFRKVSMDELEKAGREALGAVLADMTVDEKNFLCSFYRGAPEWEQLGVDDVHALPAVRWKVENIQRMTPGRRQASLAALHDVLGLEE